VSAPTQQPDRQPVRGPAPSVQDFLDNDSRPVPDVLRYHRNDYLGDEDIDTDRYLSSEWHRMEVERVWRRVWQFACREEDIPEVGDHVVYEIADDSLLVTRTGPGEIRAYFNACLHRGRALRTDDGNVPEFRCPFHGFTWGLSGELKSIPCAWDFPHVDYAELSLPEAQVATWKGFVFLNMDPDCEPFESFIGGMAEHWNRWTPENRYKSLHIAKVLPCNWKVAQEAFLEAWHTVATHPQLLPWLGDSNSQYDVPGDENWNRTVTPQGVPSPHVQDMVTEQDVLESYYFSRDFYATTQGRDLAMPDDGDLPQVPEGGTARQLLAENLRAQLKDGVGENVQAATDSELLDAINYLLFPNFHPWGGSKSNIVYRFRPYKNDPDRCIAEVMFLSGHAQDEPKPKGAAVLWVGDDQRFADIPQLGLLGPVFDQDMANLPHIQQGMKTMRKPGVTLGTYQESRIRHFHTILDEWMKL
jgi:phenylpropionate dioxygenase-like ring-hydroxylating dioxygenase large terminal subunit